MTPDPAGSPTLRPLAAGDVPAAAALVTARYRQLRASVPVLPATWADVEPVGRIVGELVARGSAMGAFRGGELVGFQAANLIDGHGGRWAYTPDVGHAATERSVAEALYAALADGWVRDACLEHVVTVFADDAEAVRTYGDLGFGVVVVDLVRDLGPIHGAVPPRGATIRRAVPGDAPAVMALEDGLRRHLAASPVFLRLGPPRSVDLHRRTLADPAVATFLAEEDGRRLAFLRIGPSATDVATIVRDAGTASITAAFTLADRRGEGVARALLGSALAWAQEAGYERCAVDHESANLEAARFWRRHFVAVALSLARRLSQRVVT